MIVNGESISFHFVSMVDNSEPALDFVELCASGMPALLWGMKQGTRVFSFNDTQVCVTMAVIISQL